MDSTHQRLFEFERADKGAIRIDIFAQDKASEPVSRLLYGKFAEHLGRNVYNGMWAQILTNPGFESWKYFGRNRQDIERRVRHIARFLGATELAESYAKGIAFGWMQYGEGELAYALDEDSFNSERSQKIELKPLTVGRAASLPGGDAGIVQPIYLPLHRENEYELSFYAKGTHLKKGLHISVQKWSDRNHVLADGKVTGIKKRWTRRALSLNLPKLGKGVAKGELLALSIALSEPGTLWLDQVFLFPKDNVDGFDADIVRLIRDSRLPILRYPGGNFASGYHWKDGIGPVDQRPTERNRAWNMIEYNHVGTDELMAFCRAVGCQPMICVNAGDGSPREAADWVEYCNGGAGTRYGALRAKNGHPEPYNVAYWEIGNELYGSWQIGHCTAEEYAERYEKFYRAMKSVDPTIKIIANGQHSKWNAPLIEKKGEILRSLSIHTLIGGGTPAGSDPRKVFESLMAYPVFYEGHLKRLGKQMAKSVDNPCLAVTELQIFTNKPQLPNNATLSEALFLSGVINTCIRLDGLVEMITHSALVNHGGGLRKVREIVYPNPVHFTSKLYATQSGTLPIRIKVRCPMYNCQRTRLPAVKNVPYLDAVALLDGSEKELTLIVTNRHPESDLKAKIYLHDFTSQRNVSTRTINGPSYMARNEWDQPDNVTMAQSTTKVSGDQLAHTFPAHSVTSLCFVRRGKSPKHADR